MKANSNPHQSVFSGTAAIIGKIHKKFVKSENTKRKLTQLRPNWIEWWIEQKEKNFEELKNRTELIIPELDALKEPIGKFYTAIHPRTYSEIIEHLKILIESKSDVIYHLYEYVKSLYNKDILAVYILYTHVIFGVLIRMI